MRISEKKTIGFILFVVPVLILISCSPAASDISVNIISPSGIDSVLADSRTTFLIYFTNDGGHLTTAEVDVSISIEGGSFYSANGTAVNHFSVVPERGDDPAVFTSNNGFPGKSSKIAVVTVLTASTGTFSLEVSGVVIHVEGVATASVSLPIRQEHELTSAETFSQLAWARAEMTGKIIQMYNDYMTSGSLFTTAGGQKELSDNLLGLARWSGTIAHVTELLIASVTNPGLALFGIYLDLIGKAAGQPDLLDMVEYLLNEADLQYRKTKYHIFEEQAKKLVQMETDTDTGFLDDLKKVQLEELTAWHERWFDDTDQWNVFDKLNEQEILLGNIKIRANEILHKVDTDHGGARALFSTMAAFADQELRASDSLLTGAYLIANQPPEFSEEPDSRFPKDKARGVEVITNLSWSCSDKDKNPLIYDVYLKKENESVFKKITPLSLAGISRFDTGRLDPLTTYEWYVNATDTRIKNYIPKGSAVDSPVWSFTTGPSAEGKIDLLYVPEQGFVGQPVEVDAVVSVFGEPAELKFELWDGENFIKQIGDPISVNNSSDPRHFSRVFSHDTALPSGKIKAVLKNDLKELDSKTQTLIIYSSSGTDSCPSIMGSQVQGKTQDGTLFLYDSGPLVISFLIWDDGQYDDIAVKLAYAVSEETPDSWSKEKALTYQQTEEFVYNGAAINVFRFSFTLPPSEFGPLADGKKTLWVKPVSIEDDTCHQTGLERVFNFAENPVKDDDTLSPEIHFQGQALDGTPGYMVLTPRNLDISILVSDAMVLSGDGTIFNYSSGMLNTRFGYSVADSQVTPSTLSDDVFNFYNTSSFSQAFQHTADVTLGPGLETKWLIFRVIATEADDDWVGDGFIVKKDWTAQIPDDDDTAPEISDIVYPSKVNYTQLISVTAKIRDQSGLAIDPDNGMRLALVYTSFDKKYWEVPLFAYNITEDHIYHFSIPPGGGLHVGETLYFYLAARDGDNDRENDAATRLENNSGEYYAVQITDPDFPTIKNISPAHGSIVNGMVPITADVEDASGQVAITIKINGRKVGSSLPFVWNTMIPSLTEPVTIADDISGWSMPLIAGGEKSELWAGYLKDGNLYVIHSLDGITWDEPIAAAYPRDTILRPVFMRDEKGTLWLAFQDYDENSNMSLYVTSSEDDGRNFSQPVAATGNMEVIGHSLMQQTSNGKYGYAFRSYDDDFNLVIQAIGSNDGKSWDSPVTIDANRSWDVDYINPLMVETPDHKLCVIYRLSSGEFVRSLSADGQTWSGRETITLPLADPYPEPGFIMRDAKGIYWMTVSVQGSTYLLSSEDLLTWKDPVHLAEKAMDVGMVQTGDGTFWFAVISDNSLKTFHSIRHDKYTIAIEAKDAAGNTTTREVVVSLPPAKPILRGDMDDNGILDLKDALLILELISGQPCQNLNLHGDVDQDGKADFKDMIYILQEIQ